MCTDDLISKESRGTDAVGAMVGDLVGGLDGACFRGAVVSQSDVVVEHPMPVAPEVQDWCCCWLTGWRNGRGVGWMLHCCIALGFHPVLVETVEPNQACC